MDKITCNRLEALAEKLEKFLELHPEEQEWLFPLLGRAEQRAIKILQEISNHPATFEEIGKATSTHPTTVKQTLYALSNGGIGFRIHETGKWLTPVGGRKRKLIKL